MKHIVAIIGLCFAFSQSTQAQEGKVVSNIEIPGNAVNQSCEIVLKNPKSKSTETDAGKIVRFDDARVVLVDATRTLRVEKGIPILGNVPYLGRLFRNTGISIENVPGELTIDRNEIGNIKFAK